MDSFKNIIAVEGLYLPQRAGESYGADVLVARGLFTLLIRYQYNTKADAMRAVAALKARDKNAMPKTDLPQLAYIVDASKVR